MKEFILRYRLAPNHPYPIPTEDCYKVTRYVIENPAEFNADVSRLVMAGDSVGGTIVATLTQRMHREKLAREAKIQILIYPLTQLVDPHLPSQLRYVPTGVTGASRIAMEKVSQWYFGILNQTADVSQVFKRREHFALISDSQRERIASYLDMNQIEAKYKRDADYYETAKIFAKFPSKLSENSVLRSNTQLTHMFRMLFNPSVSPLFANDKELTGLPKAYFILLEWDFLKDEGLLYANRLKKAGVQVYEAFYENAFHGIACSLEVEHFTIAKRMLEELISYLKTNL